MDLKKVKKPHFKLDDDEHVIFAFTRARISLALIFGAVAAGLIVVLLAFLMVLLSQNTLDVMGKNFMYVLLVILLGMAVVIALVALIVYRGNKLFITNKRVIQMEMKSPVVTSLNMIDLASVEDASFHQNGIMQKLFHYGTLRLSTVGDETTYTFPYAEIRPDELKAVSKLITESKSKKKN